MTQPNAIASHFDLVLKLDPAAPALEFEERWYPWSYFTQVRRRLDEILNAAGLGQGAQIGLAARNRPAHAAAFVALIGDGRCAVTFNPFVAPEKLAQDLGKVAIPALVADEDDWAQEPIQRWAREHGVLGIALTRDEAEPVRLIDGFSSLGGGPFVSPADGVAVQMLTSGTTGEPKRIPLNTHTLAVSLADGVRSGKDDGPLKIKRSPALLYAPLVHAGGMYGLLFSMWEARPVTMLEKFTVPAWTSAIRRHRPKFASLVPTLIRMILDANVPKEDLSSLIAVRSGTAPLDADTHRAFEDRYGIPILINYGATEFAGAVAGWTLEEYRQYGKEKFGSVGRARGDIALRVVSPDDGEPLPAGEIGILEITANRLGDKGWQRTTDLAAIDADGFLFMHGRSDDAIIRGGFKVLPEHVADVLRRHPGVADAVVIAMPDPRLGQVPVAALEAAPGKSPTPQELDAFAREHLVAYQVPVRYLIVETLPRTPSLKVSRPMVRELFTQADAA